MDIANAALPPLIIPTPSFTAGVATVVVFLLLFWKTRLFLIQINMIPQTQKKEHSYYIKDIVIVQTWRQGCWENAVVAVQFVPTSPWYVGDWGRRIWKYTLAWPKESLGWRAFEISFEWSPSFTKWMSTQTNDGFWVETFSSLQFCFREIFHEQYGVNWGGQMKTEKSIGRLLQEFFCMHCVYIIDTELEQFF